MTSSAPPTSDYVMPSLGSDMDEGTIVEWNVAVGDRVHRGDIIARVETDKSDIDIEIWHDGIVDEILVPTGRLVPVGTPLFRYVVVDGADPSNDDLPERVAPQAASDRHRTSRDVVWATPLARRIAGREGVRLTDVEGSGPGGAVRRRDVLAHLHIDSSTVGDDSSAIDVPAHAPSADDDAQPPPGRGDRMRQAIAARMTRANTEIPHYYLEHHVDLTALDDHLAATNSERELSDRVLPAAAFIRATALAAARHGELNGHWIDGGFVPAPSVVLAVAISLRGGGLVTPQISDADHCDLATIMSRLKELTVAARAGVLRSETTAGRATITVTNLGERGADLVYGLISPPEVALVGFGRPGERPWVVDGEVRVRRVVSVTLSADHRATDGAVGSRFLGTVTHLLEHPEEL